MSTGFLFVKILDIGFVTSVYFAIGTVLALLIDQSLGEFDEKEAKKRNVFRLLGEILIHMYFIGIVVYLVRNIVQMIPSPVDGRYGYEHARLKELGNASVFTTIFVIFQRHLRGKIYHVHSRLAFADDTGDDVYFTD